MAAAVATPLNLVGLCAGVGMLDEGVHAGLEHLGFAPRVLAYVERESYAAATLLARMEDQSLEPAPVWCGDLERLDCGLLRGRVDGVVAGFPCQPWSVAGAKLGTDDDRWIFPAIVDIVRASGAWLVLLENVGGLVSGGGLNAVLAALAEAGFDAEWLSLRAADVGASHQRNRVFIAAVRRGCAHFLEDAARIRSGQWTGRERILDSGEEMERAGREGVADADWNDDGRPDVARSIPCPRGADEGAAREQHRKRCRCGSRHGCEDVADDHRSRLQRGGYSGDAQGRQEPDGHAGLAERELFAPGPGDLRWRGIIDRNPGLAPAVEPGLRVLVDGVAVVVDEARADQLRCAGNGVVPLWAAVATVVACRRLMA
jgi:DNA (cytosine-5)-methyltransferase 1